MLLQCLCKAAPAYTERQCCQISMLNTRHYNYLAATDNYEKAVQTVNGGQRSNLHCSAQTSSIKFIHFSIFLFY